MTAEDSANSLISAAILLQEDGETSLALQVLLHLVGKIPDYSPAHVLLGVLYQAAKNPDQAEYAYRRALELDPKNPDAVKGLIQLFTTQQRYPEALAYLRKQLTDNPADSIYLELFLETIRHLPNHEAEVIKALRSAWEFQHDPEIGIRYGRYLLGRNPNAAKDVFSAVVDISKTPRTLTELALSCVITKDYPCALNYLKEAVELDPNFDRAWRGLSHCYLELNEVENALESAERALAINPSGYRNWQAKADVLIRMEQYELALLASQKGIEIITATPDIHQDAQPVLAVLFIQRFFSFIYSNDLQSALNEMATARLYLPQDIRFYAFPAEVLTDDGQLDRALQLIDSIGDPAIARQLIIQRFKLLHLLGRSEEAWQFIRPSLEKNQEKRLDILASIGVEFYMAEKIEAAIAVYRQLFAFQPNNARIATNLAYMLIGLGELDEAERLLQPAAAARTDDPFQAIAQCNLAYLFALTGDYAQALKLCEDVLKSKFVDEDATLRVPIWTAGSVLPDPLAVPGRQLTLGDAARACAASASLALGHTQQARMYIESITAENADFKKFLLSQLKAKTVQ